MKDSNFRPFIPAWMDDAGLSPAEMRVFIHLLRSADNKTGVAWPAYGRMMEVTMMGKSTVRRAIEELERRGLIAKLSKPFGGSCRYSILPNSSTTAPIDDSQQFHHRPFNSSTTDPSIVPPEGQEGTPKKGTQGKQSNLFDEIDSPPAHRSDKIIEDIYQAYPRKAAKPKALKAIRDALKKIDGDQLLTIVKKFSEAITWKEPQYIPHPATWFNQERWTDDPKEWKQTATTKPKFTRETIGSDDYTKDLPTAKL